MPDLRELADKAMEDGNQGWWTPIELFEEGFSTPESEFIAVCSPKRILAMLDVIEAARSCCNSAFPDSRLMDPLARLDALDEESAH